MKISLAVPYFDADPTMWKFSWKITREVWHHPTTIIIIPMFRHDVEKQNEDVSRSAVLVLWSSSHFIQNMKMYINCNLQYDWKVPLTPPPPPLVLVVYKCPLNRLMYSLACIRISPMAFHRIGPSPSIMFWVNGAMVRWRCHDCAKVRWQWCDTAMIQ